MRTSKDEYVLLTGEIVAVSQSEQPPQGARIWNGYDYQKQFWVHEGERDTRTLEELRATLPTEAKALAMSDIGLTEDEAEQTVEDFEATL